MVSMNFKMSSDGFKKVSMSSETTYDVWPPGRSAHAHPSPAAHDGSQSHMPLVQMLIRKPAVRRRYGEGSVSTSTV